MLMDLVYLIMGSLPDEFKFMYIFGIIFILYIFLGLFKIFIDIIKDFVCSIW